MRRSPGRDTGEGSIVGVDSFGNVWGKGITMLWALIVVLLILWLLGFTVVHVGSLIHLLLIIALAVLIYQLITGRRAV